MVVFDQVGLTDAQHMAKILPLSKWVGMVLLITKFFFVLFNAWGRSNSICTNTHFASTSGLVSVTPCKS